MYKTLGGIAAAFMLLAIAAPGTAAAQRPEPGIQKQAVGEEFSSQRRRVRRAAVRRYQAPYSYSYGSYPYLAGYGTAPYPAAWETGWGYSGRGYRASSSSGNPYLAGYGSAPYPAAWEMSWGYPYSGRRYRASSSYADPYYAGYGSAPYPAAFETSPRAR